MGFYLMEYSVRHRQKTAQIITEPFLLFKKVKRADRAGDIILFRNARLFTFLLSKKPRPVGRINGFLLDGLFHEAPSEDREKTSPFYSSKK